MKSATNTKVIRKYNKIKIIQRHILILKKRYRIALQIIGKML